MAETNTAPGHNAATGAHTEVHGKASFPPFEKENFPSQLVSFGVAFVLLYVIVSRLALPRVGSVIAARQNAIDSDLAAAAKLKDESNSALAAYEADLASARAKAQTIGSEIREKLHAEADAERKSLEERLTAQLATAEKTIATTRQTAMGNVHSIAADAASAIVQRLTGATPDGAALDSAVGASLKG
jgi:F-type H+-transporting ATPase subunit b